MATDDRTHSPAIPQGIGHVDYAGRTRATDTQQVLPPGWSISCVAAVSCAMFLYGARLPGIDVELFAVASLCAVVVGWVYVLRLINAVWLLATRRGRLPIRGSWHWLVVPMMAVLTSVCLYHQLPLLASFAMSRGAMEQLVRDVHVHGGTLPPRRTGWYEAKDIHSLGGGGAYFFVRGSGSGDSVGFAYLPPGSATPPFVVRHFLGDWYILIDFS